MRRDPAARHFRRAGRTVARHEDPRVRWRSTRPGASIGPSSTGAGTIYVISTGDDQLYQAFYALLLDVSDRVQLDRAPVVDAINDALRVWRRLLAGLTGLTHEERVGLTGELWALLRLMGTRGAEAVDSWTGPAKEAHDFRLDSDEIEVKTTSGQRRRHQISRLDQLSN